MIFKLNKLNKEVKMGNINTNIDNTLHQKVKIKAAKENIKIKDLIPKLLKKYVGDKNA